MSLIEQFLQLIAPGDPVAAGVVNRPLSQLDQRLRAVVELLDATLTGSAIYARGVTVEAAAAVGMPVYFNATTQQFERGLAQLAAHQPGGLLATADSSQIWGIVFEKQDATTADLLLAGYATVDLTAAIGSAPVAGTYYLSSSSAGQLVNARPPISVPVLRSDGDGNVYVVPQFADFLDRHTHYKFPLVCLPAGDTVPPLVGHPHVITSPSDLLTGWLPASDPSFNGLAPPGAVFGYNIAADLKLSEVWPPLPVDSAYLEFDRGLDYHAGLQGVPQGHNHLVVIDRNGIWWLSDCYGNVPWPTELNTANPSSASASYSDICPRPLQMSMNLYFTRVNFATADTVVTSLTSKSPQLLLTGPDGKPATAGDLALALSLNLVTEPNQAGYQVLKGLSGNTFSQGPVCEGLYAATPNVTLTSPQQSSGTPKVYYGPVGVAVQTLPSLELEPDEVRLDSVEVGYLNGYVYLAFEAGIQADFRGRFHVPADLSIASPYLALRLTLLGRSPGTLPPLTVTYRHLPRTANGLQLPAVLPDDSNEIVWSIDTAAVLTGTTQYVEAQSQSIPITPGEDLYFSIQRSSSDGYAGEVGILQMSGIVQSGAFSPPANEA